MLDSTAGELIKIVAKRLDKHPVLRGVLLAISLIFALASGLYLVLCEYFVFPYMKLLFELCIVIFIVAIFLLAIILISFFPEQLDLLTINERLEKIANKREQLQENIKKSDRGNVQEIISLNLNQLDEYYTINKRQNKSSYNFSVFSVILGLGLIVTTIVLYYSNPNKYTVPLITGITGLISEFIGATSFVLYKESNKHLNDFIERLSFLQKIMLAIDLTERLPEEKKNEEVSKIIENLIIKN